MKLREELQKIMVFVLITGGTMLLFAAVYLLINRAALQAESRCYELLDGPLYAMAGLCVLVQTMMHRRFVFRAKGAWHAVCIMVLLALFWTYLPFSNDSIDPDCARIYTPAALAELTCWMTSLWLPGAYCLQRFVLYRESLDTLNTNEKGE